MRFNDHSNLEGGHAIFPASSWRWINDDPEGLVKRLRGHYMKDIGTILHDFAERHIKHGYKLNKYLKKEAILELVDKGIPAVVIDSIDFDTMFDNLMNYVNDCIGFKMIPEVVLYYNRYFFGTADAIRYSEEDRFLRIFDCKTGVTPAHIEQLMIYAALFCLEYKVKPSSITIELRIYQNNEIIEHVPSAEEIVAIMERIVENTKFLRSIKEES